MDKYLDRQESELTIAQEKEVLERLKILKDHYFVMDNVLKEYKNEGLLYYSEEIAPFFPGMLYWVRNNEGWEEHIKELEKAYNIRIYHGILNHYNIGDILTLLFVGSEPELWEQEKQDLKDGYPLAYAWNMTDDFCSEFGTVHIKMANGGLNVD